MTNVYWPPVARLDRFGLTTLYSDDFNRANGAPGGNWTEAFAGSYFVASNKLVRTAGGDFIDWAAAMPTSNHWVQADVTGANTLYVVIHGRLSGTIGNDNCYMGFLVPGGGVAIGRNSSGVFSPVQQVAFTHGDTHQLRLELQGSQQRLYVDNVLQLTTNDTNIAAGTKVGFNSSGPGAGYDNFAAGSL